VPKLVDALQGVNVAAVAAGCLQSVALAPGGVYLWGSLTGLDDGEQPEEGGYQDIPELMDSRLKLTKNLSIVHKI